MKLSNRCFAFFRSTGDLIAQTVWLHDDHSIAGISSQNERRWEYKNSKLIFLNESGKETTEFHTTINNNDQIIFLGKYCNNDEKIWHILIEKPRFYPKNDSSLKETHLFLQKINDTLDLGVRNIRRIGQTRKILFLVHNMATWDSLEDVYNYLTEAEDFEVIVASIARRFPGEYWFGHEEETHKELTEKGIKHIRFNGGSENENINLLKCIAPDGIFRQSPWDQDIPPEFSTSNLKFTNLFYIPYYGFNIVQNFSEDPDERDLHADQDFHRICGLIFCETALTRDMMARKSSHDGNRFVATGHPKLEKLLACNQIPDWPIPEKNGAKKKLRIIWAPHHSIAKGWLSFGLFLNVYEDMLNWLRTDQNIEIVLKPHPALFSKVVGEGHLNQKQLNNFLTEWENQPNGAIVHGGNYGPLLAASDIMLTDGISFLAEYMMFFEKPLIFMENCHHAPFNEIGLMIKDACYITHNVEETRQCVRNISHEGKDVKKQDRKSMKGILFPFKKGAAERIVSELRSFFA